MFLMGYILYIIYCNKFIFCSSFLQTDGKPDAEIETVLQQFEVVKNNVVDSHPQFYVGDHVNMRKFVNL